MERQRAKGNTPVGSTVKKKRKARLEDCIYAAELARLYRERHPRPARANASVEAKWITRNDSGGTDVFKAHIILPTERRGIDIGDALEWFAAHGTFAMSPVVTARWNAMACRFWFDRKRASRLAHGLPALSSEDAIAEIAEMTGLGERTVRGAVYGRSSTEQNQKK